MHTAQRPRAGNGVYDLLLYSCTYTTYIDVHVHIHMYRKIESSVLPCAGTRGGISRDLAVMSVTVTG